MSVQRCFRGWRVAADELEFTFLLFAGLVPLGYYMERFVMGGI